MADLAETIGLAGPLDSADVKWRGLDFETLYQDLWKSDTHKGLVGKLDLYIRRYFERLEIPERPTVYDYILLGLREKDLIATFNWDPLLAQAYQRNSQITRLPQIVFLHGNVAVGICVNCRVKGYYGDVCAKCSRALERTQLLFPIADKDYTSDPFISAEWAVLKDFLERAYMLTIFGYRAPSSDVAAVELMRTAWGANGARELALVEIVDIRSENDVLPSWKPFITGNRYGIVDSVFNTWSCLYPRRSCDSFAWATLQQQPWSENRIPSTFDKLDDLQSWVSPLLDEERAQEEKDTAFSGARSRGHRDHP
jgi:hypothetical protein